VQRSGGTALALYGGAWAASHSDHSIHLTYIVAGQTVDLDIGIRR